MLRINTVVGARPQFVKASVVSRKIGLEFRNRVEETIVHTGQHFSASMSDLFFDELEIPSPKYNLGVQASSQGQMLGEMIKGLETVFETEKPDLVLLYGDTNSTLAGALAASKIHIPIAHVEAGLRSYNIRMPEEINRILTDRIAKWLFCPTQNAVQILEKEGTDPKKIFLSGDVMFDSVLYFKEKLKPSLRVKELTHHSEYAVLTLHRAENTENLDAIKALLQSIDNAFDGKRVIFPIHPRTQKLLENSGVQFSNILALPPIGYVDMLYLVKGASLVLTDSGGLQKEAYYLKTPCVTLRNETEWVELVDLRVNKVVGIDPKKVIAAAKELWGQTISHETSPYGDGNSAEKILKILLEA